MKIIEDAQIRALGIDPATCVAWVQEGLRIKYDCVMPAKKAIHMPGSLDFITAMPCLLPAAFSRYGCKVVTRFSDSHPSLKSYMILCDSSNGNFLALVASDWITSMRTGATAALAIKTFRNSRASVYSFMGLGCAGMAALECFLSATRNEHKTVRLLRYKGDHAARAIDSLAPRYPEVCFETADDMTELAQGADVIVSAITQAQDLLIDDPDILKPGVLLVPVHTRGFQNCDCIFDKIFGDDTDQIRDFRYFDKFRSFDEFSRVLLGEIPGRENDSERIISYNIGMGIHDVLFAAKIEKLLQQ